MSKRFALRGSILHFLDNPARVPLNKACAFFLDGLLVIEDQKIVDCGDAADLLPKYQDQIEIREYPHHLIFPGFVDTHVHYAQYNVIASYGEHLLSWLNKYVYPEECRFKDLAYAEDIAKKFCQALLKNGTTTASVFATSHPNSVDALFREAQQLNMCLLSGKNIGDQLGPQDYIDCPESAYQDTAALIKQWHGVGRLHYSITPRFALSCSEGQLASIQQLVRDYPGLHLQTHISETKDECAAVKAQFPWANDYLAVYEKYGLVHDKTLLAHGIYLSDSEWQRIATAEAAVAFCPNSNLFLGSGLFDLSRAEKAGAKLGVGCDVGAGSSFSLFHTMADAYKVLQLQDQKLSPYHAFYLMTRGGAEALALDDEVGSLQPGHYADIAVIDWQALPILADKTLSAESLEDILFKLMMLGDERVVAQTYVAGSAI
jgi:guanine deaminase